jgi:hypothetical protein
MGLLMPMPLDQWDRDVGHHLDLIEAGAEMCARHAAALALRPALETKAEFEMARAEAVLTRALDSLRRAQTIYRDKEVDQ